METTLTQKDEVQSKFYPIFLTIFTSSWLISTIASIKTVYFFGITLTGGFIIFPVTAAISILIADVYGYKGARLSIWCGTLTALSYLLFINLVNLLPPSPLWKLNNEFQSILLPQNRIILASIISFWFSTFLNSVLMAKLKINNFKLMHRTLIAALLSLTLDLSMYFIIGFLGTMPTALFKKLFFCAFCKKIICELLFLPMIWKLIDIVKTAEGFDLYDFNTNFTPFSFDNIYSLSEYKQKNNSLIKKSSHKKGLL